MTQARQHLGLVALLVRDYDEAISFFRDKLGFALEEDSDMGGGKRWVAVCPPGGQTRLLLARAVGDQALAIGHQGGGRVFLFLETDDFERDHARYLSAGVKFLEAPRHEAYGSVAVFEDVSGNRWDLIQRKG